MKNLLLSLPFGIIACAGNTQTINLENSDTTVIFADTNEGVDYSGTYEYVYPNNSLDFIQNHFIVLTKNDNATYSGRYYGTSDLFDEDPGEYLPGFFVLPMENILIEEEKLSFDLSSGVSDFFNEPVYLSSFSSADAASSGLTEWDAGLEFEPKSFKATFVDGCISLENQTQTMNFVPMK